LEQIREGKVRRLPRAYFVLRVAATAFVSLLLLAIAAYLISFILFSLHESGEQFLLGYGLQGIIVFLALFPWGLLVIAVLLIFLLEWLIQGFRFAYRLPLLQAFAAIVGISVVFGFLISLTPLHPLLQQEADNDQLPLFGPAYEQNHEHHEDVGISRGMVIATSTNSFVLKHNDQDRDNDEATYTIVIPPGSQLVVPRVGEEVVVFGTPEQGTIQAQHIEPFSK